MGRWEILLIVAVVGVAPSTAPSQTVRYPRVYGPTGRPYGPTQAHYQYQKQYGRPWHGYGGITANIGQSYVNGYPAGQLTYGHSCYYDHYAGYDWGYGGLVPAPGYPLFPNYTPAVPRVIYGYPPVLGYNPLTNPTGNLPATGNFPQVGNPALNLAPAPNGAPPLPLASSPEAKLKSVRAEAQGDMWFQKQEYHKAFDRYKTAVSEASDRGAAHLRLAVCYAALNHMDLATRQLKRGIAADPQFAENADVLKKIYGDGNQIAQSEMVHRAALWLKEDIRDPDRLFLLGTLLHLQKDERAPILLKTGLLVQGGGDHFREFLRVAEAPSTPNNNSPATGNVPQSNSNTPVSPSPQAAILPPLPTPSDSNSPPGGPLFPIPPR
ncbi:MAG: tetratricopeptide repeat protein [Planctomycetaceae bacterium]|nr:tetratricopeptide repeat protein [Planctomycetaceae bacterium]